MTNYLKDIPTNIITGFLGVGKTTAILHLLQHKPEQEKWAILVNEFGKIGIDAQVLQQDGVAIKEIPGGCMCCAAGVSVQVGINTLLAKARPDRLLIEPTGVGHPRQIIRQLSEPPFDQLLNMKACVCLIDPRHLQNERYTTNDNYNEQLDIADVIVANKIDHCSEQDKTAFDELVLARQPAASGWVSQGQLDPTWLELPHKSQPKRSYLQKPASASSEDKTASLELDKGERYRRAENRDKDYASCGWLFADHIRFQYEKIITLFEAVNAERIKASLHTDHGNYIFNSIDGDMSHTQKATQLQNRVEFIMLEEPDWDKIEGALLSCISQPD